MQVLDPGHVYQLDSDQTLEFIKRTNGELVHGGTTNEELLRVLINRTEYLDAKFPCEENKNALQDMVDALYWFTQRTIKRVEQGVETKDIAHVS